MAYSLVFDVPMEFGLELMSVVGSDLADTKRELLNNMVDEVDSAGLRVFLVDFEHSNTRRIIDCRILETTNFLTVIAFKRQKLNVHLNMMAWNLLVVAFGVDFPQASATR